MNKQLTKWETVDQAFATIYSIGFAPDAVESVEVFVDQPQLAINDHGYFHGMDPRYGESIDTFVDDMITQLTHVRQDYPQARFRWVIVRS